MRKRTRAKRVIQVPIDDGLLSRIDETASVVAESRSEFIREACRRRLRDMLGAERDRRYREGYERRPEEPSWAEAGVKALARTLPREKW